ncbi:MAG TPA: fumarylacetoacetate hydrolase family protein [Candidatus Sulfotelmatobacter sp.]|jgi:fumarylpyruvate hydrolase|nr:fumarylacetoacetate hydrolase family protein [Candidatus Sulfotelmatobacter sp.]
MTTFVIPSAAPTVLAVSGGGQFPVRRIFCVGQNYADHAREMGGDPDRAPPFFFTKPTDAVISSDKVPFAPATNRLDYEGELVVCLASGGADIPVEKANDLIYGYAVGCDLTRRDLQAEAKKAGRPWDMAKGFDASAAIGSVVAAAKIGHPAKGAITLAVNGAEKQKGDLDQMIWSIPEIIATLSNFVTLAAGDLIFTGTPAGVGPLAKGDTVDIAVAGIGTHSFTLI